MVICLFCLRIGKSGEPWRIAYGLVTPSQTIMPKPSVSEPEDIGSCQHGRMSIRKVIYSEKREIVYGIFDDLAKGISLKTSFNLRGIDSSDLVFDVTYYQEAIPREWGIERVLDDQMSYTKSICMLDPTDLFEKEGSKPEDVEKAIETLENKLRIKTKLPFGDEYDHVGNLDIIIVPDRDDAGRPLVDCPWEKGNPCIQRLTVNKHLLQTGDTLFVNIVCKENERVSRDMVEYVLVNGADVKDVVRSFSFEKCPDSIEIKIWRIRDGESIVISDTTRHFLKRISLKMSVAGVRMSITTAWLQNIRKNASEDLKRKVDDASSFERSESVSVVIGEPAKTRVLRRKRIKSNDEFFPQGWDNESRVHGLLSFLDWFRNKANKAKCVFLQDPYFEDVGLYFLASASVGADYTILTQTKLKTNPDGTIKEVEDGEESRRKRSILEGIEAYPRMFNPMKLLIIDVPVSSHNILHDRYLIFDYGENRVEAYTLSNSLQGATNKQPLLITQIGDDAFVKVSRHIEQMINRDGNEIIYDFSKTKSYESKLEEMDKVADKGFFDWLHHQKDLMKSGDLKQILEDIRNWRTNDRLATLGYFLVTVSDSESNIILEHLGDMMKTDPFWVGKLKEFVLREHFSEYPIGFIHCPFKASLINDVTSFLGSKYYSIVSSFNTQLLDSFEFERYTFGVYSQLFAAQLLLRLSISEYVDILRQLKPTLLGIKTDKTVEPCHKVTLMLMTELMEFDMRSKKDDVMTFLLADEDEWCRGVGALIFLQKAKDELFDCKKYESLLRNSEELIVLCHAAWGMKPAPAHIDVFYDWLKKEYLANGSIDYFEARFFKDVLGESHLLEDKVDYVKNVVVPLIGSKLIDKDVLARDIVDAFFEKSIEGEDVVRIRPMLPDCLFVIGGDLSHMFDLAKKEVEQLKKRLLYLPVKSDNTVYQEAKRCIELRILLIRFIEKYNGNKDVEKFKPLLADLDNTLDEYGLSRVKRSFESYSWI